MGRPRTAKDPMSSPGRDGEDRSVTTAVEAEGTAARSTVVRRAVRRVAHGLNVVAFFARMAGRDDIAAATATAVFVLRVTASTTTGVIARMVWSSVVRTIRRAVGGVAAGIRAGLGWVRSFRRRVRRR